MIIDLADAKAHLNVTTDADDALITSKIEAAEGYLAEFVDCDMTPEAAPPAMKEAVRQLVGTLYENRESAVVGANLSVLALPTTVSDLISPYRTWSF